MWRKKSSFVCCFFLLQDSTFNVFELETKTIIVECLIYVVVVLCCSVFLSVLFVDLCVMSDAKNYNLMNCWSYLGVGKRHTASDLCLNRVLSLVCSRIVRNKANDRARSTSPTDQGDSPRVGGEAPGSQNSPAPAGDLHRPGHNISDIIKTPSGKRARSGHSDGKSQAL
jgi:hypothetical protein